MHNSFVRDADINLLVETLITTEITMDTDCTFSMPAAENFNESPIVGLTIALSRNVYIPAFKLSPNRYMKEFDKPQRILVSTYFQTNSDISVLFHVLLSTLLRSNNTYFERDFNCCIDNNSEKSQKAIDYLEYFGFKYLNNFLKQHINFIMGKALSMRFVKFLRPKKVEVLHDTPKKHAQIMHRINKTLPKLDQRAQNVTKVTSGNENQN